MLERRNVRDFLPLDIGLLGYDIGRVRTAQNKRADETCLGRYPTWCFRNPNVLWLASCPGVLEWSMWSVCASHLPELAGYVQRLPFFESINHVGVRLTRAPSDNDHGEVTQSPSSLWYFV